VTEGLKTLTRPLITSLFVGGLIYAAITGNEFGVEVLEPVVMVVVPWWFITRSLPQR